eukprot:GHVU01151587.1.p2 GENE.GHVU01151587.1~~GHVU01151587.1.p2  ORF type:complete len:142 (+),score=6.98 GHVU01151587.1:558-983(+)
MPFDGTIMKEVDHSIANMTCPTCQGAYCSGKVRVDASWWPNVGSAMCRIIRGQSDGDDYCQSICHLARFDDTTTTQNGQTVKGCAQHKGDSKEMGRCVDKIMGFMGCNFASSDQQTCGTSDTTTPRVAAAVLFTTALFSLQ